MEKDGRTWMFLVLLLGDKRLVGQGRVTFGDARAPDVGRGSRFILIERDNPIPL